MRNEQIVAPLAQTILRPQDGILDDIVLFVQDNNVVTPYFSSAKLSFEIVRAIRAELKLPPLKDDADIAAETQRLLNK